MSDENIEELKKQIETHKETITLLNVIIERHKAVATEYFQANLNFHTNQVVLQDQIGKLNKNLQEAQAKIVELSQPKLVEDNIKEIKSASDKKPK